jgi:hypothetical protein
LHGPGFSFVSRLFSDITIRASARGGLVGLGAVSILLRAQVERDFVYTYTLCLSAPIGSGCEGCRRREEKMERREECYIGEARRRGSVMIMLSVAFTIFSFHE